jgi:hypothetical protein
VTVRDHSGIDHDVAQRNGTAFSYRHSGPLASGLFGWLIGTGSRRLLSGGDVLAALLLLATAGVVAVFGVRSERASLEQIASPLSATGVDEAGAG